MTTTEIKSPLVPPDRSPDKSPDRSPGKSSDSPSASASRDMPKSAAKIVLSVVIPSFNEKENLRVLIPRLRTTLASIPHEIIVVDDSSPDRTSEFVRTLAEVDSRVRVIRRYGRRGLSSAVIEGILASAGRYAAVLDADLQHDETRLPVMFRKIVEEDLDLVSASRFLESFEKIGLSGRRQKLSQVANRICNYFLKTKLTDPMTGFFLLRRSVFDEALPHLSPMGFKILFDILVSHPSKELKYGEIPFQFRDRHAGESKLDAFVAWEFFIFIAERVLQRRIPGHFISFSMVGAVGVLFHMAVLKTVLGYGFDFFQSHTTATAAAIGFNFFLNNRLTYSSARLKGAKIFVGLLSFYLICSVGAVANVGVASFIHSGESVPWVLSALAGIAVGTFWNFGMSRFVTWNR